VARRYSAGEKRYMIYPLRLLAKSLAVNLLPKDLFRDDIPISRAKTLFATFVRVVEIENHSYCNRTCWFCPNSTIDRRSKTTVMTGALFEKIVSDLASIHYGQTLIWSRYHEPLAHESIFERLARARHALPAAQLALVSNGDYLNRDMVRKLEKAGLDRLMLDLYLPEGKERDEAVAVREVNRFADRTGLTVSRPPGRFECTISGSSIRINMGLPNYTAQNISTRAGLVHVPSLENYQRTASCLAPTHSVVVDFNGKGVLCCQTRSDAALHQNAIIADLTEPGYSLFHMYRALGPTRLALLSPGQKNGVCKTCSVSADGPDRLSRRPWLANMFAAMPGTPQAIELAMRYQSRRRRFQI
jgi:hypothetical protein